MIYALVLTNVALLAVIVYMVKLQKEERQELYDRIQAPETVITRTVKTDPAVVDYVDQDETLEEALSGEHAET